MDQMHVVHIIAHSLRTSDLDIYEYAYKLTVENKKYASHIYVVGFESDINVMYQAKGCVQSLYDFWCTTSGFLPAWLGSFIHKENFQVRTVHVETQGSFQLNL